MSPTIDIGGDVELDKDAGIGLAGAPVPKSAIAGDCDWKDRDHDSDDLTCGPVNNVFASVYSTAPTGLQKPTVNFPFWYQHADISEHTTCTRGSLPGKEWEYDDELDMDSHKFKITPKNKSYSCQVDDATGKLVGELSWDYTTRVLEVLGTIYVDGDISSTDDLHGPVNYQGRATIYASGSWHNHQELCAGGDGTRSCIDGGMTNWDPTENLLWIVTGALEKANHNDLNFHKEDGAFQGGMYARNKCKIKAWTSGPIICTKMELGKDKHKGSAPRHDTWPPLSVVPPGEIIGPGADSDYRLFLGPQY
jgi:hypothetical protein